MKNVLEYLERSARLYPDKTAFEDLDRAMIEALQMSMDAVTRRGAVPHPRTAEALRWLKTQN